MNLPLRELRQFRNYTFRRELRESWFASPFYQEHYGRYGIQDSAFVAFPINEDCEPHFGFWAERPLGEAEIALPPHAPAHRSPVTPQPVEHDVRQKIGSGARHPADTRG